MDILATVHQIMQEIRQVSRLSESGVSSIVQPDIDNAANSGLIQDGEKIPGWLRGKSDGVGGHDGGLRGGTFVPLQVLGGIQPTVYICTMETIVSTPKKPKACTDQIWFTGQNFVHSNNL